MLGGAIRCWREYADDACGGGEHERLSGRARSGCCGPSTAGANARRRSRPSWCCFPSWSSTAIARRIPGSWPSRCPTAPAWPGSCEIAKRHRLVLCAGLSEKERDIVYNTQVLVGPARLHRQAAQAAPVARRDLLLQGRPRHPGLRHRPVQGRHRHLLRQPISRRSPACWRCAAPR